MSDLPFSELDHATDDDIELASAYLDGEATATEESVVEASPPLLALVAQLAQVHDRLAGPIELDPGARQRAIDAAVAATPSAPAASWAGRGLRRPRRRVIPSWLPPMALAVAAVAVVALGLAALGRGSDSKTATSASTAVAAARDASPNAAATTAAASGSVATTAAAASTTFAGTTTAAAAAATAGSDSTRVLGAIPIAGDRSSLEAFLASAERQNGRPTATCATLVGFGPVSWKGSAALVVVAANGSAAAAHIIDLGTCAEIEVVAVDPGLAG